jgi:hypothetical protein
MRLGALLFFIQTLPSVVFIAALLFGGFSVNVLKEELATSGMYEKVISVAKEQSGEADGTDQIFTLLQSRLTPDYLQPKIEKAIDDTSLWVTGKTNIPPTLSFKDIKDELEAQNPTLLADLQKMSQEVQTAAAAENNKLSPAPTQQNELETFVKNDFSFPLKDSVAGLKQTYTILSIGLPVLIVLLLLSLVCLGVWNRTWQKRLRWLGTAFILAGIFGYASILFYQNASAAILNFFLVQKYEMFRMVYPILNRMLMHLVNQYLLYQTITNYVLLALGGISIIISFVIKSPTPAPVKPVKPVKAVKKSR